MKYEIPEENIVRLRKKVAPILRKATKRGVDVVFEEGEPFYRIDEETGMPRIYIPVDAQGCIKTNGWEFVGMIEHTEKGNVLRSASEEHPIPVAYADCRAYCDHCHATRNRAFTYIVYNEETAEFKQVGKSCLQEYTNGLSVEIAALRMEFDRIIRESETGLWGMPIKTVYDVFQISKIIVELIRASGYANASSEHSTKRLAATLYKYFNGMPTSEDEAKGIITEKAFDETRLESTEPYVTEALEWARNLDGITDYDNNLKVIAGMKYCKSSHLGYLASLFVAYEKHIASQMEKEASLITRQCSRFIGSVGDTIEVDVASARVIAGWETEWGWTRLYEFIDKDGNVYTWKSTSVPDIDRVIKIKGKVKAHRIYEGIEQTELTRCRAALKD